MGQSQVHGMPHTGLENLPVGLHAHTGSQIWSPADTRVAKLAKEPSLDYSTEVLSL